MNTPAADNPRPRNPHRAGPRRRICFVTGSRAEFGLMESALDAIAADAAIQLQIVATGMHLDRARGYTLGQIETAGWRVDATVPWNDRRHTPRDTARATGLAIARLSDLYHRLNTDVVLVVGDRVEAFAAAAAGHIAGRLVAHVHGGDRALGQVDDSLRHAITKLAHVHFAATAQSAQRLRKLGEDAWRVYRVGSPGIDNIRALAVGLGAAIEALPPTAGGLKPHRYALLVLHPETSDDVVEEGRARMVLDAVLKIGLDHVVVIHPNNDPGAQGIAGAWRRRAADARLTTVTGVRREVYLGLLRDAAVLVGNSSSGIIEAAGFRTPVLDIGQRQAGRQRSANVAHVPWSAPAIAKALARIWNRGHPARPPVRNVYGAGAAGKIAGILGRLPLDETPRRKLIAY